MRSILVIVAAERRFVMAARKLGSVSSTFYNNLRI